jgi:murein DD-endopeptidase MepM/ murein hydrolase activator NlpD
MLLPRGAFAVDLPVSPAPLPTSLPTALPLPTTSPPALPGVQPAPAPPPAPGLPPPPDTGAPAPGAPEAPQAAPPGPNSSANSDQTAGAREQDQEQRDRDQNDFQTQDDRNDARRRYYEQQQSQVAGDFNDMDAAYGEQAARAGGGKGQFVAPEIGRPPITQGFGCSTLQGEPYNPACSTKHFHQGVDLAGRDRTPVFAADTGYIRIFKGAKGYGNFAMIEHGNHWRTLYGHLAGFAVEDRTLVHKGDVIGFQGSTGYSTGSHLHFEVRFEERFLDPCDVAIKCSGGRAG